MSEPMDFIEAVRSASHLARSEANRMSYDTKTATHWIVVSQALEHGLVDLALEEGMRNTEKVRAAERAGEQIPTGLMETRLDSFKERA